MIFKSSIVNNQDASSQRSLSGANSLSPWRGKTRFAFSHSKARRQRPGRKRHPRLAQIAAKFPAMSEIGKISAASNVSMGVNILALKRDILPGFETSIHPGSRSGLALSFKRKSESWVSCPPGGGRRLNWLWRNRGRARTSAKKDDRRAADRPPASLPDRPFPLTPSSSSPFPGGCASSLR